MAEGEFDRFLRHVNSDSVIEIALKAHLLIEDRLVQTLTIMLKNPEYLDLEYMGFKQKILLTAALGYISEYELKALTELNKLRNKLAHRLDSEITHADVERIIICLKPTTKAPFLAAANPDLRSHLQMTVTQLYLAVTAVIMIPIANKTGEMLKKAMAASDAQEHRRVSQEVSKTSTGEPNSSK